MDAGKKSRIARIAGFICLGVALLNATFAVLAMVADKNVHKGTPGLAVALSLFAVGIISLTVGKRRPPPDAFKASQSDAEPLIATAAKGFKAPIICTPDELM